MKKSENYRNEIKSYIVRAGMTMTEVVDCLAKKGSPQSRMTLWGEEELRSE
jgi:hypothetical protein